MKYFVVLGIAVVLSTLALTYAILLVMFALGGLVHIAEVSVWVASLILFPSLIFYRWLMDRLRGVPSIVVGVIVGGTFMTLAYAGARVFGWPPPGAVLFAYGSAILYAVVKPLHLWLKSKYPD